MIHRPLPEEFIRYARTDTHYLLYIYDRMKNDLLARVNGYKSLLMSVFSASNVVCAKVWLCVLLRCVEAYWELL